MNTEFKDMPPANERVDFLLRQAGIHLYESPKVKVYMAGGRTYEGEVYSSDRSHLVLKNPDRKIIADGIERIEKLED